MTATSRVALVAVVCAWALPGTSFAQVEWREFVSKEDKFSANFPGDPVVTPITWQSDYGASVPARVYSVTQGSTRYAMTVVDYNLVKAKLIENAKNCPPDNERCLGHTAFSGEGYWKNDLRGAMIYAAFQFMKRDVKVDHYMWSHLGHGVEVYELQLTNNPDKSRTFVSIYMHYNVLYVMEATVPGHYPPPGLFTQSVSLHDPEGMPRGHGRVVFNGAEVDPNETYGRPQGSAQPAP